jgi:hypothetical protein
MTIKVETIIMKDTKVDVRVFVCNRLALKSQWRNGVRVDIGAAAWANEADNS